MWRKLNKKLILSIAMKFVITVLNLFEDIIKVQKRIIFYLKKEIWKDIITGIFKKLIKIPLLV